MSDGAGVVVHLIDGTYELFRHHFGAPEAARRAGRAIGVRGVLGSVLTMIEHGTTHLGVATDHVVESFRNAMWPGYKSSAGVAEEILAQFEPLEEALEAMGVRVWPMVELEADDALASAAAQLRDDQRVRRVVICTPDKDLAQCVVDGRVVQLDRRKDVTIDAAGVQAKFGVLPESIPDWLALTGDSADGFPGLPGWGAKSAAAVLARYRHLENIPSMALRWDCSVRGATQLASTLDEQRDRALLFRDLATLRVDVRAVPAPLEALRWVGPTADFAKTAADLGAEQLAQRASALAAGRTG